MSLLAQGFMCMSKAAQAIMQGNKTGTVINSCL